MIVNTYLYIAIGVEICLFLDWTDMCSQAKSMENTGKLMGKKEERKIIHTKLIESEDDDDAAKPSLKASTKKRKMVIIIHYMTIYIH